MTSCTRLFATASGLVAQTGDRTLALPSSVSLDALFAAEDPAAFVAAAAAQGVAASVPAAADLRAPVQGQEIWAAGVTYLRSRNARMEEAKEAGGGSFYDRVYEADRPELFFKGNAQRVGRPGGAVRIRADARWNVPEPELTLAINTRGRIFGYTVGNDMSSRDIEGENPLYLPQAKVYHLSSAIGPCLVLGEPPSPETAIRLEILRAGAPVFSGETRVSQIKRSLPSLAEWLYREDRFPCGAYLMTGTGIVPPDTFTLQERDEIRITIEPVGTLVNVVSL
jgi:2-dehydro-3-deoxy-D-arabinonate dehydratase